MPPPSRASGEIPNSSGSEFPATFGQSADAAGNVYVQWHRRDNAGRVDVLRLEGDVVKSGEFVPGTDTNIRMDGLLSFAPVSIREGAVYRVKPENGRGLIRHDRTKRGVTDFWHGSRSGTASADTGPCDLWGSRWFRSRSSLSMGVGSRLWQRLLGERSVPRSRSRRGGFLCRVRMGISMSMLRKGRPRCRRSMRGSQRSEARSRGLRRVRSMIGTRTTATFRGPIRTTRNWRLRCECAGRDAWRERSSIFRSAAVGVSTATPPGTGHRGGAGYRAIALAEVLAGRVSLLHFAALSRREIADPAGGDQTIDDALSRRRDGPSPLGGSFHGVSELESPVPACGIGECRHLCVG